MINKFFPLIILSLAFPTLTPAMERDTTTHPSYQDQKTLLTPYLETYTPELHPNLDTINWQKLSFSTQEEKNHFNFLVITAAEKFNRLSFKNKPHVIFTQAIDIIAMYHKMYNRSLEKKSQSDLFAPKLSNLRTLLTDLSKDKDSEDIVKSIDSKETLQNLYNSFGDLCSDLPSNFNLDPLSIIEEIKFGLNLADLSEQIITQTKLARALYDHNTTQNLSESLNSIFNGNNQSDLLESVKSLYEKNNPSDLWGTFNFIFSENDHPLIHLFDWIKECALGNVIIQENYEDDDLSPITLDHGLPIVEMSKSVKEHLITYNQSMMDLLTLVAPESSGEYGLHALIFNKWRALSNFTRSPAFKKNPLANYKIVDAEYLFFYTCIEIPRIPEKTFEQKAHPAFVKVFKKINEKKNI